MGSMTKFRGFDNGTGKRVLNKMKTVQLRFREIKIGNYNKQA